MEHMCLMYLYGFCVKTDSAWPLGHCLHHTRLPRRPAGRRRDWACQAGALECCVLGPLRVPGGLGGGRAVKRRQDSSWRLKKT